MSTPLNHTHTPNARPYHASTMTGSTNSLLAYPELVWQYNQLYHTPGLTHITNRVYRPRDINLLRALRQWHHTNEYTDKKNEVDEEESTVDWLSRTLIAPLLPAATHFHRATDTDSKLSQLDASGRQLIRPDEDIAMNDSSPPSIAQGATASEECSDGGATAETERGDLEPLRRHCHAWFTTPKGQFNSHIIFFPDKVRVMRQVSDREFQQDLLQAQTLQTRIGQLLNKELSSSIDRISSGGEKANDVSSKALKRKMVGDLAGDDGCEETKQPKDQDGDATMLSNEAQHQRPSATTFPTNAPLAKKPKTTVSISTAQVAPWTNESPMSHGWSDLYHRLCDSVEPTVDDKVQLGEVDLTLFLSWFISDHTHHSIEMRTIAAVSLLRLLLATRSDYQQAHSNENDSTVIETDSATVLSIPTNRSSASTITPSMSMSQSSDIDSCMDPVATIFGPSLNEVRTMIKIQECLFDLPGDISYQVHHKQRESGEEASKKLEQTLIKRHRRLNQQYVLGKLTTVERSMIRGLIMHFSLAHLNAVLLNHLTTLIILLSHWDQLQTGWMTYFSSLAWTLTQYQRPIHQSKKDHPMAYYAYSIIDACIRHYSMSEYDEKHEDPWYVYVQHLLLSSIGQRALVRGEVASVAVSWLGSGLVLSSWQREGAIRLLEEAAMNDPACVDSDHDAEMNPYDLLRPHLAIFTQVIFHSTSKAPAPLVRPIDVLIDLFLPLIIRSLSHSMSSTGQAQIDQLARDSSSPDRPKNAYGHQPPIKTRDEIESELLLDALATWSDLQQQLKDQITRLQDEAEEEEEEKKEPRVQLKMTSDTRRKAATTLNAADELKVKLGEASVKLTDGGREIWCLMRPHFLSSPPNAKWYQVIGDGHLSTTIPLHVTREQCALVFEFNSYHGLSTPNRRKLWSKMPLINDQQIICQENLCASIHLNQTDPIISEPFCLFIGRLGVRGGLIEGDINGRPVYDPLQTESTGGVRLIDTTLTYDPDRPPRPVTQAELFACENILAFCRSYSTHSLLAVTLELAALKRAMESDSHLLRLIALVHQQTTVSTSLKMCVPMRPDWSPKFEAFALHLRDQAEASLTCLKSTLNDVIQLPNVLTDMITQYYSPSSYSYAPLWNVLPFLIQCLLSNVSDSHRWAMAIFRSLSFPYDDDDPAFQTISSHEALSLPTEVLRPFFEQILQIVEMEITSQKERLATGSEPEKISTPTPMMQSLLIGRLNLRLPSSHPNYIPSGFLEPFMSRLTRIVLDEQPTSETLIQLLSSPTFQRAIFFDANLLERVNTLLLTPGLVTLAESYNSIVEKCAHGLGRRIGIENQEELPQEMYRAMSDDWMPNPLGLPTPLTVFLTEINRLFHITSNGHPDVTSHALSQFPSLASDVISRCSLAAANQTHCFFLWLLTHEQRIYHKDDSYSRSRKNENQTKMKKFAHELLDHVHSCLRESSDVHSLPLDVARWPFVLATDLRTCIDIYAKYEYPIPRLVMSELLAGLSIHPQLARELIWPLFESALKSLVRTDHPSHRNCEDEAKDAYHTYNALISIYWWAIEDVKRIPMEVGSRLVAAIPAIQQYLLEPFQPHKAMKGLTDAAELNEVITEHANSPPWQSALVEAVVLFHHITSTGILKQFITPSSIASSFLSTQSVSVTAIDQVGLFILGWLHDELIGRLVKEKDMEHYELRSNRNQRRQLQPRLSEFSPALRMSLLEWYAEWLLATQTHPSVQALVADPIARTWLTELDGFIRSSPPFPPSAFKCWRQLITTLSPHPIAQLPTTNLSREMVSMEVDEEMQQEGEMKSEREQERKCEDEPGTKIEGYTTLLTKLDNKANLLKPFSELLNQLRSSLLDQSTRFDTHFRLPWELKLEPLDQRLVHLHQLLRPQLQLFQCEEFARPLQVTTPLARLMIALSRLLNETTPADSDSFHLAYTICRAMITATDFAFQLDAKKKSCEKSVKPETSSSSNLVYTISSAEHPPLPLSDLFSATSSIFDSLLLLTALDSLPVALTNLIAQAFSALFQSPQLNPYQNNWLERLIATVPASSLRGEERFWLESPPWPHYQDPLSAITPSSSLAQTVITTTTDDGLSMADSSSSSSTETKSLWLLPSSVTRFRVLACIWYRCFGQVDGKIIDAEKSITALATLLIYFTSFLIPSVADGHILHEVNFVILLFARLNSHCLQWHKAIYDQKEFRSAYPKIVEAFQAFAHSLPVIRSASWSQLPKDSSDEEISLAMEKSLHNHELKWSSVDDKLCDAFFTTLLWMPLTIDYSSNLGETYRLSRTFIPLYGVYLQRLAHRFRTIIEYEASQTFESDYQTITTNRTIHRNGIAYHLHFCRLLFMDKHPASTPSTDLRKNEPFNTRDHSMVDDGEDSETHDSSDSSRTCSKCTRPLADEVGFYGCARCEYFICLDCGDPHALPNLLYASTRAMFLQLTTMWRWTESCGWILCAELVNSTREGGYFTERLRQARNWIRPIIPLLEPFIILTRRDQYTRELLKSEPNLSAYKEVSFEPSMSLGLLDHDSTHSILFDQESHSYSCYKCSQLFQSCSYWCPICDQHFCIPCAKWSPSARHTTSPAALEQHRQQFLRSSMTLSFSSGSSSSTTATSLRTTTDGFNFPELVDRDTPTTAPLTLTASGFTFGDPAAATGGGFSFGDVPTVSSNFSPPITGRFSFGATAPPNTDANAPGTAGRFTFGAVTVTAFPTPSAPPAFPISALPSEPLDGLFYGPCEMIVNDYLALFKEKETAGPQRDAALNEIAMRWNSTTVHDPSGPQIPLWQLLWSRYQLIHAFSECNEMTSPTQLQTAISRVFIQSFSSESMLVRALVMTPVDDYQPMPALNCLSLQSEFGSGLLRLQLTTPTSNVDMMKIGIDALKKCDHLNQETLLNTLASICTRRSVEVDLLEYLASHLPPLFNSLVDSTESVGLIYAFFRRILPQIVDAEVFSTAFHSLVSLIGWRIVPNGQKLNPHRSILREMIQTKFESFFTLIPVYAQLIQQLPPTTSATESTLNLAQRLKSDMPFLDELKGVQQWFLNAGQFCSFEAVLQQESISQIGRVVLGPNPNSEFVRQLAIIIRWSVRVLPRLPYHPQWTFHSHNEDEDEIDLIFGLLTWSCAIPRLHASVISPNIGEILNSTMLHLHPIYTAFESYRPLQDKIDHSNLSLIQKWFTNEIGGSNFRTLKNYNHTDNAARLLLRILALGQTRHILIEAIKCDRKTEMTFRVLFALFTPLLTYFESLLGVDGSHRLTSFSLRPPLLGHFSHQLKMSLQSSDDDPFIECVDPVAPNWAWYALFPTLAAVLIQLAQSLASTISATAGVDVDIDSPLMQEYSTFRLRVERLWPVWCVTLAPMPHASVSHSLMATYVRLNRILPRTPPTDPFIRSTIHLWHSLSPPNTTAANSKLSVDSSVAAVDSPADCFYSSILLPLVNSGNHLTWVNGATRQQLPKSAHPSMSIPSHHPTTSLSLIESREQFYQQLRRTIFDHPHPYDHGALGIQD